MRQGGAIPTGPTFLEAKRLLDNAQEGRPFTLYLGMSGTSEPLVPFLRAVAARRGLTLTLRTPPFGTLTQALLEPPRADESEAWLLFPWDLLPEADWRTGVSRQAPTRGEALERAGEMAKRLSGRAGARLLYVAAATPPLASQPEETQAIEAGLLGTASAAGAEILSGDCFSLSSYLTSGCPIAGASLGGIATLILEQSLGRVREPCKVLVTDFDNTLWSGVLSEDGESGIEYQASGQGFRHFVYQTLLARLEAEGVLLAGVTRNSPDVVEPLLKSGDMVLTQEHFVAVVASYHAKSSQIAALARRLNLGLDSMVFVDDNEVELEEAIRALPELRCVRFPRREDELPDFLERLADLFARERVTAEDRERTVLYRRRLDGMLPEDQAGADITDFLQSLRMELSLADRSQGDRSRAVQLINKTNQFNLNGRRWSEEEIGALLAAGGRLICSSLDDRSGSHGEIVACLIGPDQVIESWVMSCRVFQRRVEYAFLLALLDRGERPVACRFKPTDRNEPIRQFLADPAFGAPSNGLVTFDAETFRREHGADLALFEVHG